MRALTRARVLGAAAFALACPQVASAGLSPTERAVGEFAPSSAHRGGAANRLVDAPVQPARTAAQRRRACRPRGSKTVAASPTGRIFTAKPRLQTVRGQKGRQHVTT